MPFLYEVASHIKKQPFRPLLTHCEYSSPTTHCEYSRASDFPFQKKQFSVSKKGKFRFNSVSLLPELNLMKSQYIQKKYSIESKLSLDENIKTEKQWFH